LDKKKKIGGIIPGMTLTPEELMQILPRLKEDARQQYLDQRVVKQLELYMKNIEKEIEIQSIMEVTEEEKQDLALKKQTYENIKKLLDTKIKTEGYMMPESIETKVEVQGGRLDQERKKLLNAKLVDTEEFRVSDSQLWEQEQAKYGIHKIRKQESALQEQQQKYDLILENKIDFILKDTLPEQNLHTNKKKSKKHKKKKRRNRSSSSSSSSNSDSG
jgi:hypothetical protein